MGTTSQLDRLPLDDMVRGCGIHDACVAERSHGHAVPVALHFMVGPTHHASHGTRVMMNLNFLSKV
ncbi:MAG: hypothetical protein M3Z24_13925 [Chloroflexota bacterium]|nr:hypothetical protein [Chloroflexota bacterium]